MMAKGFENSKNPYVNTHRLLKVSTGVWGQMVGEYLQKNHRSNRDLMAAVMKWGVGGAWIWGSQQGKAEISEPAKTSVVYFKEIAENIFKRALACYCPL